MKQNSKRILALALAGLLFASLAACAKAPAPTPEVKPEKVLLAVSFGTSYDDNRELSIGAVESALQTAFPDYELRRAFTSQTIIDILADRDIIIDNVTEAMDRLVADGVKEVLIQPTHVMSGFEYDDTIAEITPYADQFEKFSVGAPLLTSQADFDEVVSVLTADTADYAAEDTAIVLMGHGTEHASNAVYAKLQEVFKDTGYDNYIVGTAEHEPALEDVVVLVGQSGATKVVLMPLMIVAGDHASNDMAGDEEDSWKSVFTAAGYEVETVLKGLGQYPGIQAIFVRHASEALTQ